MRRASSGGGEGIAPLGTHRAARIVAGCDAPARPIGHAEDDVVRAYRHAVEILPGRRADRRDDRRCARYVGGSPTPFAPYGASGCGCSMSTVTTGGMSRVVGSR